MSRRALQPITFIKMGSLVKPNAAKPPQVYNSPSSMREEQPVIGGSLGVSELSGLLAEDAMDLLSRAGAADRVGELQRI